MDLHFTLHFVPGYLFGASLGKQLHNQSLHANGVVNTAPAFFVFSVHRCQLRGCFDGKTLKSSGIAVDELQKTNENKSKIVTVKN